MDEITTGVFTITASAHDFLKDWQEDLAKEELRRRARTAMEKIMRDGVPYVTCLYPIERQDNKLILTSFCALAQWEDCKVGEAVFVEEDDNIDWLWIGNKMNRYFEKEAFTDRNLYKIYIYRRTK